jgi:hypothetical protein
MKNNKFHFKNIGFVAFLLSLLALSSCTKKFEQFNTDSNGVTNEQLIPDYNNLGSFFPLMEYAIGPAKMDYNFYGVLDEYHIVCPFAGYTTEAYPEESPGGTYNFIPWKPYFMFQDDYSHVMAPFLHLRTVGTPVESPHFWAVALIIKVAAMDEITDRHGPIPYSQYGKGGTTVAYDSQKDIYTAFFAELDTAVTNLKAFIAEFPTAKPFSKFDKIYAGDYSKWLKYANSLRLRLAMHIVKRDPAWALAEATKALDPANGGVIETNADNAVAMDGDNLLWSAAYSWFTMRINAAIICFMDGYKDPRIGELFTKSSSPLFPEQYVGIKTGSIIASYTDEIKYSNVNPKRWTVKTPTVYLNAAEVQFLLAEASLRGWSTIAPLTPQQYYEAGTKASMDQWGISSGATDVYLNDATSTCKDFVDPLEPLNNSPALTTITIKWDDAASNEQKLERIITQKWLALYPDGSEAWTTFRRTGYPKLFPITPSQNHSAGTISTEIQVRRIVYPQSEYGNNLGELQKALVLLGGPDEGGVRLWWDVDAPNF